MSKIDFSQVITAEAQALAQLEAWRASAKCSRMQGILALGEDRWAKIMAHRETATWAERIVIDDAGDWLRKSENIAFFAYLLDLSDAEVDDLFRAAQAIAA